MIESFFKTLKYDEVYLCEYETFEDVVTRLAYFIEEVYNMMRSIYVSMRLLKM